MANYLNTVPFILSEEGGLSNNPNDKALLNPINQGVPYHTNKGVQWATFLSLAPVIGYSPDYSLFLQMPNDIWGKIFKIGYWDEVKGDQINDQSTADTAANFEWGSGGKAIKYLQQTINDLTGSSLAVDGVMGPQTLAAVNSAPQPDLANAYYNAWHGYLQGLEESPLYSANTADWEGRLARFAIQFLTKKKS